MFRNVSQHGLADLIAWRPGEQPTLIDVKSVSGLRKADGSFSFYLPKLSPEQPRAGVRLLCYAPGADRCFFAEEAEAVAAQTDPSV